MEDVYLSILKKYWGYDGFRGIQREIIESIGNGRDTLGLMPTGGGKSITFQVPALSREGICIVVTPLIALMKDQVRNLRGRGIKAAAVYSGLSREEILVTLENCIFGNYKFLYVSPERLASDIFLAKVRHMPVSFLTVDEAHCISQWGYDFRPSYTRIAEIRKILPDIPVLALTATATPEVVKDIQRQLAFREENAFRMSFERKNLAYIVRHTEDKFGELIHILNSTKGSAIVYTRSRRNTRETTEKLQAAGMSATFYHAGLNDAEKDLRQHQWQEDKIRIMVATNAFGMGIDKPDVRVVVHLDMPGSLEEYYQEAGRAGRDERKAYAVALCSPTDTAQLKKRISDEFPPKEFIYRVYEALGNYFQIAVGYGLDTVHDFMLTDFCSAFKLPITQTHSAIKLLELAGYLEYVEEVDNASRLIFTATREELYSYLRQDELTDAVIKTILRSYTGLFADYVYINESLIATRAGCTPDEVYHLLVGLSKYRIVNYVPQKKTPLIIYRQVREEQKYLSIPRSAYEERKARNEARISKVLEYIHNTHICRTRILLGYFGEKQDKDCGTCDVCLQRHSSGLTNAEFHTIQGALEELLRQGPLPVSTLLQAVDFPQEKVLQVVRFLADNDAHFHLEEGVCQLIIDD